MIDVEFPRTRTGDVGSLDLDDLDRAASTACELNNNRVTRSHCPVGLASVAVDLDPTALTGGLGLRAGLEQARHVKPNIQPNALVVCHRSQCGSWPGPRQGDRLTPSAGRLPPGRR